MPCGSGANGPIIGDEFTIVATSEERIDLTGIEDHTVRELPLVHAAAVGTTHLGEVIIHVYNGAHMPDGKSILAPLQIEAFGGDVKDKAKTVNGGEQLYVQSRDGYRFPMKTHDGLMYMNLRPVLKEEWERLPHVHLVSNNRWDPRVYDHGIDDNWADHMDGDPVEEHYKDLPYDRFGNINLDGVEDGEGTTRAEIEANLTELIRDELVDSVIEHHMDGDIPQTP